MVLLPGLSLATLESWLARHEVSGIRRGLCRDRGIRGAALAWKGHGLLCADAGDSDQEQRFTLAHEAGHYLQQHYYPRRALLERFGAGIQPVVGGLRPPTTGERVDAVLGGATFDLYTHLMERDYGEFVRANRHQTAEADADAFAWEMLAPRAVLRARFPQLREGPTAVSQVAQVLTGEFGLPSVPAERYARHFVGREAAPESVLHRLRLL
ncbi:MAG: ImmA/IrrE family metallo-endopeptidase [Armatimonadetes bacterium]|nr:ImmA/IrrE family metallo-endopeptidase [Armatimonadota bacterium]